MASVDHAPLTLRAGARRRAALVGWLGVAAFLAWAITFFLDQLGRGPRRPLSIGGIAVATVVLCLWAAHSVRLVVGPRRRRASTGRALASEDHVDAGPVRADEEGSDPAGSSPPEALARWAIARLDAARAMVPLPEVLLVRAGDDGVELLLRERIDAPPPGFNLVDTGHGLRATAETLSFAPGRTPDAEGEDSDVDVVELGSDCDGTYFAPSTTTVLLPGDPREVADDAAAVLVVVREPSGIVVEPLGLRLSPPLALDADRALEADDNPTGPDDPAEPDEEGAAPGHNAADAEAGSVRPEHREPLAAAPEVSEDDEDDEVSEDDEGFSELGPQRLAPGPVSAPPARHLSGEQRSAGVREREPLMPPGPVEVRILRDDPDLVGELLVAPSAPAVEFVAYLATHDHRATTARLRDCLGTAKSLTSRSSKTVWSAASDARRALGEVFLPPCSGAQPYELSGEVSCDWGRFQALCAIARRSEDPAEARRALIEACSLVEGVPGLASRRFTWLDEEGLLAEMTRAITGAARRLAELELETLEQGEGSRQVARRAIATWRLLAPGAPALVEAEQRLELVRR